MLNNAQKRQLKGIASTLKTKYQLGKRQVTPTIIDLYDKALTAHELIKITIMNTVSEEKMKIAFDLSSKLNAEIVQTIGNVIVLYRKNKEKTKIQLVK